MANPDTTAQRVWLVTGCSSGLGECFVRGILSRGDKVIATGRKLERLKHLEESGAAILQLDITADQETIRDAVRAAVGIYGRIDVLVNNASYIQIGTWEDLEYEDFLAQFNTNVFGTIKVTRALLGHFRERRRGNFVFLGSRSGWFGDAMVGAYSGSKFALEGLVEALKEETEHLGIKTLLVEPGRFRTKLLSAGNLQVARPAAKDYEQIAGSLLAHLAEEDQRQQGDPDRLVSIVLDLVREEGIAKGKQVPFRLPIGTDVGDDIQIKCRQTLDLIEEWRDVIYSTDFDSTTADRA